MKVFFYFWTVLFTLSAFANTNWIILSNKLAEEFTLDIAKDSPESASSLGYSQFDSMAVNIEDDIESRDTAFYKKWKTRLNAEINNTQDVNYKMDIQILLDSINDSIESQKIYDKYGDIPFYPASKFIFNELQTLVNPQSSEARKKASVDRFKAYVNGHDKYKPLLEAYQSRIIFREKKFQNHKKFYSLKSEIELYLTESPDYLNGIKELLSQSGRNDWQNDFNKFSEQLVKYDNFIKSNLLPKARTDYKLPKEIYAFILKIRGIKTTPENLIEIGLRDYKKVYLDFQTTAIKVAEKYGLKNNDPVSVLKFLKSKQISKPDDALKLYVEAQDFIEKNLKEKNVITIPTSPLKIQVAGDAESKANPVPRLQPPPLINNHGERPVFVIPSSISGTLPFDDFSYKEAAYILVAHEGRPGHDMQFSSMLDNGISIIRARYAFNNVNVEGWALNAEDMVFSFLPVEAQLSAIQLRLWRIARMFLDPQIQLGKIKPERVNEIFTKELGVSSVMAELEARRYTFGDPGQAPAYYYGLLKIRSMRDKIKNKFKEQYSEKCFNDSLLSMGLLPLDIIEDYFLTNLSCGR